MKRITINLTDHQHDKLRKLAAVKTRVAMRSRGSREVFTIEKCIQHFAEFCVVDQEDSRLW